MTSDGTVLACPMWSSADDKLYLLDCRTGETIWAKSRVSNHYYPPVSLTKDLVLYQPWGPKLHAISRATGEPAWLFHNEFTGAGCCTPAVSGQYAYLGTSVPERSGDLESLRGFRLADTPSDQGKYGTMNALDLSTGKSVWRFPTTNTICGDPAIAYGRLYFASRDGRAYCFAPAEPGEPVTPEARHRSPPVPEADVAAVLARSDPEPKPGSGWPMQGGSPDRAGSSGVAFPPRRLRVVGVVRAEDPELLPGPPTLVSCRLPAGNKTSNVRPSPLVVLRAVDHGRARVDPRLLLRVQQPELAEAGIGADHAVEHDQRRRHLRVAQIQEHERPLHLLDFLAVGAVRSPCSSVKSGVCGSGPKPWASTWPVR